VARHARSIQLAEYASARWDLPPRSAGSCTTSAWSPPSRKRLRSSYWRFEADQPNQCWQSDFVHWALAGGADAEIINWLDDHSRCLLARSARSPVTGKVASSPRRTATRTAPDSGQGREIPPDPETLAGPPAAPAAVADLQCQLDAFRKHYNEHRANRTLQRSNPRQGQANRALPKAEPDGAPAVTTGGATTTSTPAAKSASAMPAACTTSASAPPTTTRHWAPARHRQLGDRRAHTVRRGARGHAARPGQSMARHPGRPSLLQGPVR
jgi:hypothetical protein